MSNKFPGMMPEDMAQPSLIRSLVSGLRGKPEGWEADQTRNPGGAQRLTEEEIKRLARIRNKAQREV